MVGASTSVYKFDNVVRGQHIHKSAWTPLTDKTCKCILQEDKEHDKYAVTINYISIQKEDAYIHPVHYPTRDLLGRLGLLKQGVTIFIIT